MKSKTWRSRTAAVSVAITMAASGVGVFALPVSADMGFAGGEAEASGRPTAMADSAEAERPLTLPVAAPAVTQLVERKEAPAKVPAEKTPVETVPEKESVVAVSVSGRVVLGKTAVAGGTVTLTDSKGTSATVKTNAEGAFAFTSSEKAALVAGPVTVRVAAPGMVPAVREITVKAGVAVAMAPISATAAAGPISGTVRAVGAKAVVADASVMLSDSFGTTVTVKTNAEGVYAYTPSEKVALAAGSITVTAEAAGFTSAIKSIDAGAVAMVADVEMTRVASIAVTGRVVMGKTAVAGATVTLTDAKGTVATVKTNAEGAFAFASSEKAALLAGPITVRVAAPGMVPVVRSITVEAGVAKAMDVIAATAVAGPISGTVRVAGAKAVVAGATVTLTDSTGAVATVKADAEGAYAYAPGEKVALAAGPIAIRVAAPGYATTEKSVEAGAEATVADIDMAPSVAVTGRVAIGRDAVAGATVTLTDSKGAVATVKTDAKGAFAFASNAKAALAAGPITVRVAAPGMVPVVRSITVEAGVAKAMDVIAVEAAAGPISGTVRVAGAKAVVAGATVTLTDSKGAVATVKADAEGAYAYAPGEKVALVAGPIAIRVAAPGYVAAEKSVEAGADPVTVDFEMAKAVVASIAGVVRATDGKAAVAGATVTLTDAKGAVATVKTDEKGAYAFASSEALSLAAGPIAIRVAAPGYVAAEKSVEAGADPVTVDFEMAKAAVAVAGVVRDADTKAAIAGAKVVVSDSVGRSYAITADSTGAWEFTASAEQPLEPGTVKVAASVAGYRTVTRSITAEAGTAVNADLSAKFEAMTFSGVVSDTETGLVVPAAKVTVADSQGAAHSVESDAAGAWTVTTTREMAMDEGAVTVSVDAPRFESVTANVDAVYGAQVIKDSDLDYRNLRISGVVKTSTGAGMVGARVQITDSVGNKYTDTTNSAGEYEFVSNFGAPIESGAASLVVNATGYNEQVLALSVGADDVSIVQGASLAKPTVAARAAAQLPVTGSETSLLVTLGAALTASGMFLRRRTTED